MTTRTIAAAILLVAPVLFAQTQNPAPPPCAANTKPTAQAPCTPAKPPAASSTPDDPFPFPGGDKPSAPPPDAPASAPVKPGGSDDFPFPGETPSAPAKAAPSNTSPASGDDPFPFPGAAPGSSSSSSSSSSDNGAPTSDPDDDLPVQSTLKHPRAKAAPQTDDEREMEDLKVAKYYRDRGNFNAVYLRSKDAVKTIPDDPEAHLMLAEAARKLNKRDEAIAEYKATLQFDPTNEQKKTASRGIEDLEKEPAK
jgi:hypothetical protein